VARSRYPRHHTFRPLAPEGIRDVSAAGKALIVLGGVLLVFGLLLVFGERIPLLGRLPGDLRIRTDGTRIYIPITTCVLLSIVLTLLLNLVLRLFGPR
jgi:hypothetical protein